MKTLELLIYENNPEDARLIEEHFKEKRFINLTVVRNKKEAAGRLRREGIYAGCQTPDLILLNLKPPDDLRVLAEIKKDPALRRIPLVVLSATDSKEEVKTCYELHANCCIKKPATPDEYTCVLESIEDFWLVSAKLPTHAPASGPGGSLTTSSQ